MTEKHDRINYLNDDYPIDYGFEPVGNSEIIPPKWIIKDVIPVGLTIYIAPPKNYKSTFLLHFVLRTIGKNSTLLPEHLSQVIEQGPVLMISTETTAGAIRFDALFGLRVLLTDTDPLYAQTNPFVYRLDNQHDMAELFYWLKRIQPKILVIDPFRNSHSVDENDSGEIVKILQPLQQYAVKYDMAVIIVHHTVKRSEKSKVEESLRPESARGTGALFGIADGILMQVVMPNDESLDEPVVVKMSGQYKRGAMWTHEITPNLEWDKLKLDTTIAARVFNSLQQYPKNLKDLSQNLGLKESEVLKYVLYMNKHKIIQEIGGAWSIEF